MRLTELWGIDMSELGNEVFNLPDVGEGLTEAEVVRWRVQVGDNVVVNQIIVEIETAKAVVELPCPFQGTVSGIHVDEGETAPVGSPLISVTVTEMASDRENVLVGYGVSKGHQARRRERVKPQGCLTKPPVRKLAKDLGVDLGVVVPTGDGGIVTRDDVLRSVETGPPVGLLTHRMDERKPVKGVQKAMADAMVRSAFSAPHVTEWVEVDVTQTLSLVERMRAHRDFQGVRVTPLTIISAGLIHATRRFPGINSCWLETPDGPEVVTHGEINLGIATDTPRGLLVPSIKGAQSLVLRDLAMSIDRMVQTARSGHATPADLTGGTITITNVGVFGIDGGTPIINPGEAAILATGRILDRPWVVDGSVVARPIMQLSFSFDHRVIDGALGSRALACVADFLANPATELLLGAGGVPTTT